MRFKKEIVIIALCCVVCCSKGQDINLNRYPYGRNPNEYDQNVPYNNYPYSSTPNPYNPNNQNDLYGGGVNGQYPDLGGGFGQSPRPTGQYGGEYPDQYPRQYPEQSNPNFPQSPRQYPDQGQGSANFPQSPRQYPDQGGAGFPRQYPDQGVYRQTPRPTWNENFGGGGHRNQFDEHSTVIREP